MNNYEQEIIEKKYHAEYEWHEKKIIVDVCDLYEMGYSPAIATRYEVMVMLADGTGIDVQRYEDGEAERAIACYRRYLQRYKAGEKRLTGKYELLRAAIAVALDAGKEAEAAYRALHSDWGTCNFDSPALLLPRWNSAKVEQAARDAGTHAWKWESWGGARWVICPKTSAQGIARSMNSEAMVKKFIELGYDCFEYCQAD